MTLELALYQALISINVTDDNATAVIQALENDLLTQLATKADLAHLENKLTLRLGAMLTAFSGLTFTLIKLF